jgi:exosortase/archaeosortase family protein
MLGTSRKAISHGFFTSSPGRTFAILFALIAGVLFSVYSFPYGPGSWGQRWSDAYLSAYAHLAGWVLAVFDRGVTVSGQDILGRYSLRIIRGCDAVDAQILLASAMLASPMLPWKHRIGGAALGLSLITVANVARICSLYYVGIYLPKSFDFFHHELWPLVLIAIAAGAFLVWIRVATPRRVPV